MVKNRPACTRYWKKNMTSPPVIWRWAKIEARTSGSRPAASTCASHSKKTQIVSTPARMSHRVGDTPHSDGPPALGTTQPHSADRSTPKTARPSPAAVSTRTDDVEGHPRHRRRVVDVPCQDEDAEHHHHLAGEHPPPGEVRRRDAPDQGADRDRDGARTHDQPVGGRATLGREVRRDECHDRRHDQRRADPLEQRPTENEHRQVRRQGRRQRTRPVDDTADHEGASSPDHRADLAAGDHQHRHDQRVERDRRLDPGDRGADVLGDRGDRHVHHRAVQRHQELTSRERQQDRSRPLPCALLRGGHGQPVVVLCGSSFTIAETLDAVHHPHRVTSGRSLSPSRARAAEPAA